MKRYLESLMIKLFLAIVLVFSIIAVARSMTEIAIIEFLLCSALTAILFSIIFELSKRKRIYDFRFVVKPFKIINLLKFNLGVGVDTMMILDVEDFGICLVNNIPTSEKNWGKDIPKEGEEYFRYGNNMIFKKIGQ